MKETTYVYIDSFNLYYGFLKPRRIGCKWLDLNEWLSKILPRNSIVKIKYFTARVSGGHDADKPVRQDMYLRALKTLPNVEIIEGNFLMKQTKIHVNKDVCIMARVPEEKGTDVNLAVHLVNDAHMKRFQTAIVVSNDSDLAEAVRIVTKEVRLKVGILNPYEKFSKQLTRDSSFKIPVREQGVLSSQFPNAMTDSVGSFIKPPSW